MAAPFRQSTVWGTAMLPDIGTLAYNGVLWTQLYTTLVSSEDIQASDGRTTKYVAYTITVDGVVTLQNGSTTIDGQLALMRQLLSADGGMLTYTGKGFGNPFVVNAPGGTVKDVNWGPKPKVLEFIPLGGSLSAKCKWIVTTWVPEFGAMIRLGNQVCEFTQSADISYDADGYSSLSIQGKLEIPLTRITQPTVTLTRTVSNFRQEWMTKIASNIDLTRFKVTRRIFNISNDFRTMDWSFAMEEFAPMGNPGGVMTAKGEFTAQPSNDGPAQGLVQWVCTLRGTYTVPKTLPRRTAYLAFLPLWMFRMRQSQLGQLPVGVPAGALQPLTNNQQNQANQALVNLLGINGGANFNPPPITPSVQPVVGPPGPPPAVAIPTHFSFREGLYEDSKFITFTARWQLFTSLTSILVSTGVWKSSGVEGNAIPPGTGNLWAQSMRNFSGWTSWIENRIDPSTVSIVDFGHSS